MKRSFTNISPMSISKRIVDVVKTKLSNYKDIEEYTSTYWEVYDKVYNMTINNSKLTICEATILLQGIMLVNMGPEYVGITSTIEMK